MTSLNVQTECIRMLHISLTKQLMLHESTFKVKMKHELDLVQQN